MIYQQNPIIILKKPFLWITRKLTGNQLVKFVCEPAVAPKEVEMDANLIKQYDQDFADAEKAPIPDDDDL